MGASDGVDEREPEPGAAPGAGLVAAGEAIERGGNERRREPAALVADLTVTVPLSVPAASVTVPTPWRRAFSTRFPSACSSRRRSTLAVTARRVVRER